MSGYLVWISTQIQCNNLSLSQFPKKAHPKIKKKKKSPQCVPVSGKLNEPANHICYHQDCSIAQWIRAEVREFEALQDADSMDLINPEVLGNFSNLSELSLSHLHNADNKITL